MAGGTNRHQSGRRRSVRLPVVAAVLIGALVFAVGTEGGRNARATRPLGEQLDRFAELAGLGITQVNLSGHRMTPDTAIFDALDLVHVGSLLRFDSGAARGRLEQLPWVQTATVEREFPDELSITISERKPYAVWQKAEGDFLIDQGGRELSAVARGTAANLPVVAGTGAAAAAHTLLRELSAYPDLMARLARAERVGDRRWTLMLRRGLVVHLPADGEAGAIAKIMAPRQGGPLIDRDVAVLDLRTAEPIVVRRDPAETSSAAALRR
jgi:cell division protein FtsQ